MRSTALNPSFSLVLSALLLALCIGACAKVETQPDFDRVSQDASTAVGLTALSPVTSPEDPELAAKVESMVASGLTMDDAARVCLMNNPSLCAVYARVGMSRAEVVESSLWANPNLALGLRLPDEGGLVNVMVDVAQDISELWQLAPKRRSAEAALEQTMLESARKISLAVLTTRSNYIMAVAADRQRDVAERNLEVARLLLDAALARQQAGGGSAVDVTVARSEVLEGELELRNAELKRFEARRELAGAIGWPGPPTALKLTDDLADVDVSEAELDLAIERAQSARLDLRAADAAVSRAQFSLALERKRVFPMVELGLSAEREARERGRNLSYLKETTKRSLMAGELSPAPFGFSRRQGEMFVLGPTLSLELPVFNQNQAGIARAYFAMNEALSEREAMRREIILEVRGAHERLRVSAINARFFRDDLLPLREQALDLSRDGYRAGKTPFASVLDAQRDLLRTRGEWIDARAEAAAALVDLERAAGMPHAALTAP